LIRKSCGFPCSPRIFRIEFRSWPVPPLQGTQIVGSRITALRYRADGRPTESLIAGVNPFQKF
jgi:hypothetical protein